MEQQRRPATLRTVTPEVLEEVRRLISEADHASLGSLDPGTGWPLVSRVGLATMPDGTPLIFVSALAAHQAALIADWRSSLLIGSIGKGDPLAHPRVTLQCEALMIEPGTETAAIARERYWSGTSGPACTLICRTFGSSD